MFASTNTAAMYQKVSSVQRKISISIIQEMKHTPGDHILDMGCGTGEISDYLAKLVGSTGKVLGVDPDPERIKLAKATHRDVNVNLEFDVGSSFGFPGEGEESYDIVFCSNVLHWVSNKEEFFKKLYSSLKKGGRIHFMYLRQTPEPWGSLLIELGLDHQLRNLESKTWFFDDIECVEEYANKAGFGEVSLRNETGKAPFDSIEELCDFIHASSSGICDFSSISKERLAQFKPPIVEDGKIIQVINMAKLSACKC